MADQLEYIYEDKIAELSITAGQNLAEKNVHLPSGVCIGIAAVPIGAAPGQFTNLTVLDNGRELVQGKDYQFFERSKNGRYIDSLFPVTFDCNRTITVQLSASAALAADFKLQVVFLIARKNPTQH